MCRTVFATALAGLLLNDDTDRGMIGPRDRVTLELGPFDGTVEGICTVPSDEQAGMVVVIEAG